MAQGKQAKMVTVKQEAFILHHLTTTRYPLRDKVLFLLSIKAGLRAKEMAALTWAMVTEADGHVGETLHLVNGFCRKVRFLGKIQKSCVINSMIYRLKNSRKSNFATEPANVLPSLLLQQSIGARVRTERARGSPKGHNAVLLR